MRPLGELLGNHSLLCALIGWCVAQALKVPIFRLTDHRWDFRRFFGSGGMPSSHTSFVVSLALMIGCTQGFGTPVFAIAFTLAAIVMYDAAGVRRETGTQATVINQVLRDVLVDGKPISDEQLKELVGHTPLEVFGGVVVGLLVSGVYLLILFR